MSRPDKPWGRAVGGLLVLLLAGCAHRQPEPSEQPWNRPTKAEISRGWWFNTWNDQTEGWRKDPYP